MKIPMYRQALSHGWSLAWKNKMLWVFGALAALLGQMGIFDFLVRIGASTSQAGLASGWVGPLGFQYVNQVIGKMTLPTEGLGWIFFAFLLGVGIIFFMAVAAAASQGALIDATAQSLKLRKRIDNKKAWHVGVGHAWKLLLLHIVRVLVMMVLGLMVSWTVFNAVVSPTLSDRLIFLLVFVLAAVVGMVVSFLVIYAAGYIVVEEYKVGKAISSAWHLFTGHWLVSLEVAAIFVLLNLLLVFGAGLGILLFFLPAIILWIAAAITSISALYLIGMVVGVIVLFTFILFLGAVFSTFTTAVWTYLFMKMHKEGVKSHILHYLSYKKS